MWGCSFVFGVQIGVFGCFFGLVSFFCQIFFWFGCLVLEGMDLCCCCILLFLLLGLRKKCASYRFFFNGTRFSFSIEEFLRKAVNP